jgi:hypothetical protein
VSAQSLEAKAAVKTAAKAVSTQQLRVLATRL